MGLCPSQKIVRAWMKFTHGERKEKKKTKEEATSNICDADDNERQPK